MTKKTADTTINPASRGFGVRVVVLTALAASLFALHLTVRWAVWKLWVPDSALDLTTTFVFYWYAVAAAWGVWRDGFSWCRAVAVAAWVSVGLTLWIFAGLFNGERVVYELGKVVARYTLIYWAVFFAAAACWLVLARSLWGIRIVVPAEVPLRRGAELESSYRPDLPGTAWVPSVSIRSLMLLTATIAAVAAFLRYGPDMLSSYVDRGSSPQFASELCIDPILRSIQGVTLLTFAALACKTSGRSVSQVAVAFLVAVGLSLLIEYGAYQLKREYIEYVIYRAFDRQHVGFLDVTAPLFTASDVSVLRGVCSTALVFASALVLPSLGYRIDVRHHRNSRTRTRQSLESFSADI